MGRSEAPLRSDSNGEESLEEPTENTWPTLVEDRFQAGDYGCGRRLRGSAALILSTMSKTHSVGNSIQTTLPANSNKTQQTKLCSLHYEHASPRVSCQDFQSNEVISRVSLVI